MAKMGRYVCVGPDVGRRLCMVPTNGAEGTLVTDISLKKVFFWDGWNLRGIWKGGESWLH